MEESQETFNKIIDPETNMNVPVESKVGQQVIKNYLECLKNGPDSSKIVSTKMYYKPKKTIVKTPAKIQTDLGSIRGMCPKCDNNVYSTQERVKSGGKYYHDKCFNQ